MSRYVIEFQFPGSGTMYAGVHKNALGWAPSLETALYYDDPVKARNIMIGGYGMGAKYGRVMEVLPRGRLREYWPPKEEEGHP